jgi:TnpA family transposase
LFRPIPNNRTYRRQNQLDLPLQEVGRIERTLFMLDWLESPELRRRCHALAQQ